MADVQAHNDTLTKVLNNKSGKIVLKWMYGQCGLRIKVLPTRDLDSEGILKRLKETGNDFVEEYVVQHKDLMRLAPSGLNTLRIVTRLNSNDEVEILGTTFRISIKSSIDNWSAGNIAAPVNISTGIVDGPAFYKDITKPDEYRHPITNVEIIGFKIPYWNEALQLAKDAALFNKKNRCIGWDIAITDDGPELIEGNNNWCKVFWQLSAKKGLKSLIEPS